MDNPKHIALILDGNRRWAIKRGLPTLIGHKKGYDRVFKVADWCYKHQIKEVTFFAFSTENWNRSKKEVSYLMNLLKTGLLNDLDQIHEKGFKFRIIGREQGMSKEVLKLIKDAELKTKNNNKLIINLAVNYGGHFEITDGINKLIKNKVKSVTPKSLSNYFYIPNLSKVDMIVRTAGEMRLSGFLLWHSAYSELMFIKTCWPAMTEKVIDSIVKEYKRRNRTFGGN